MTIYFLFGQTGTGKSYVGELLEERGFYHLEGDKHITSAMREYLQCGQQMTREMIQEFVRELIKVIQAEQQSQGEPFIVSQAMYVDQYRNQILAAVPDVKFVWVKSDPEQRQQRVLERFTKKESRVDVEYAREMEQFFENPTHPVTILDNSACQDEELSERICAAMPELPWQMKTYTF